MALTIQNVKDMIIDQDNRENLIINKALDASFECLSIKDFIPYSGLNINNLFLNKLWYSFRKNIPVYLDESLIKLFG